MEKHLKYILWIFLFIIICVIIYGIIYIILGYLNVRNSLADAWFNTKYCGQKKCPPTDKQLSYKIPTVTIDPEKLSMDVAQYSSIVVYSLEKAAQDNVKPTYPSELTIVKELYNDSSNPIFGAIFTDKNNIWIAFRGTLAPQEWAQDLEYTQNQLFNKTPTKQISPSFLLKNNPTGLIPKVHEGFVQAYQNMREDMIKAIESIPNSKTKTIIVTGHSLGAAVSTLAGLDLKQLLYTTVVVYNFASPRIGDNAFITLVNSLLPLYRFVNICDMIPNMPPAVSPNLKDTNNPYFYEHAGTMIPFQVNRLSMLNNHLIPSYMEGMEQLQLQPNLNI